MEKECREWHGIPTIKWQGYEWIKHPLWGIAHPDEHTVWIDETLPFINDQGHVVLGIEKRPKEVPMAWPGTGTEYREWARCHMRTTQEFKYGTFEWEMKLPNGKFQWPALWLASEEDWPPEIDVMEGWSRETTDWVKNLIFLRIKPTCHWRDKNRVHVQESKNNILKCRLKRKQNFDKYKVVWTPDYIDVYYNDHKVKRFKDKQMLSEMNRPEIKMHAIMSSGFDDGFTEDVFNKWNDDAKNMIVKSFKYTPLN